MSSNPAQCPVDYCNAPRPTDPKALCCAECFARLPEGAQYAYTAAMRSSAPFRLAEAAELGEQAIRRLSAENIGCNAEAGGRLWVSEIPEADTLTRRFTVFGSFAELHSAAGDYYPKLDGRTGSTEQREAASRLADLYDRQQSALGDSRRAVRLGFAGL